MPPPPSPPPPEPAAPPPLGTCAFYWEPFEGPEKHASFKDDLTCYLDESDGLCYADDGEYKYQCYGECKNEECRNCLCEPQDNLKCNYEFGLAKTGVQRLNARSAARDESSLCPETDDIHNKDLCRHAIESLGYEVDPNQDVAPTATEEDIPPYCSYLAASKAMHFNPQFGSRTGSARADLKPICYGLSDQCEESNLATTAGNIAVTATVLLTGEISDFENAGGTTTAKSNLHNALLTAPCECIACGTTTDGGFTSGSCPPVDQVGQTCSATSGANSGGCYTNCPAACDCASKACTDEGAKVDLSQISMSAEAGSVRVILSISGFIDDTGETFAFVSWNRRLPEETAAAVDPFPPTTSCVRRQLLTR